MPSSLVDPSHLAQESVWLDKQRYEEAESQYIQSKAKLSKVKTTATTKPAPGGKKAPSEEKVKEKPGKSDKMTKQSQNKEKKSQNSQIPGDVSAKQQSKSKDKSASANTRPSPGKSSLTDEIARARQHIKKTLQSPDGTSTQQDTGSRAESLAAENKKLVIVMEGMLDRITKLESRVANLENKISSGQPKQPPATKPVAAASSVKKVEDDDDVDLFGSDDDEDEDKEKLKEARVQAYQEKKSKKPALIAKSNVIFDVKPWDDETDLKEMERLVRAIAMDGLLWGASKQVPLAYGIFKLQISCVVEDDKVSIDELQEKIQENEDLVQSVDIAAFNKI